MSRVYLRFTDEDGDPLALTNEIAAVYVFSDKDSIRTFPGREVRVVVSGECRVVCHTTGQYKVQESFDEIMDKIELALAAESCE